MKSKDIIKLLQIIVLVLVAVVITQFIVTARTNRNTETYINKTIESRYADILIDVNNWKKSYIALNNAIEDVCDTTTAMKIYQQETKNLSQMEE